MKDRKPVFLRSAAIASAILLTFLSLSVPLCVRAEEKKKDNEEIYSEAIFTADGLEDYAAELAYNKKQPVQTNQVTGWPEGPVIGAAGAIVMDADSGTILYGKNIDKHLYPASITKVMTGLLAYENLKLTDKITFSQEAIYGIEMGSSNIGMDVGETITVDEALNGLMVASANEVAVALGESISGSESAFADLMNQRAGELGCQNTHFVTSNGLHRPDHYTCARDMALIAKEVFRYPELVDYMSKMNYHFEKSSTQPDDFWILNTNDFLTGEIRDDDVIGGKTGYTDQARETLVTFAKRDDVRLVCVIMREEPPYEYYDTIELLNYAFDNFKKVNVFENENRFLMKSPDFLSLGKDIFGKASSPCHIPEDASLTIPVKASFSDLDAEIESFRYNLPSGSEAPKTGPERTDGTENAGASAASGQTSESQASEIAEDSSGISTSSQAADYSQTGLTDSPGEDHSRILDDGTRILGIIHYRYNDYEIGSVNVVFHEAQKAESDGKNSAAEQLSGIRALFFSLIHTGAHGSIYLNILLFLPVVLLISLVLCVIFFFRSLKEERRRRSRRKRRRSSSARNY